VTFLGLSALAAAVIPLIHRVDFNILEYLVIQNAQFFLVGWYCVLSIRKVSGWQAHPREATVPW
jgi:hypothetical protein